LFALLGLLVARPLMWMSRLVNHCSLIVTISLHHTPFWVKLVVLLPLIFLLSLGLEKLDDLF
jgi:hypothetical protein